MGVSRQQAVENRRAIVAAAEKLFRERGVDAVGLAEHWDVLQDEATRAESASGLPMFGDRFPA